MKTKKKMSKKVEKVEELKSTPEKVTFVVWFADKVAKKQLKETHRSEISTFFFKDKGLRQQEEKNIYDKILKLY